MASKRDIVTVERVISAPAAAIFDVLADPGRHPEIDGSGTVRRTRPGHAPRLSGGAIFTVDMHRGMAYRMRNTVTEFDEGRRIAWSPKPASGRGARFVGRIWRYELEPAEGGTLVRETWDISAEAGRFVLRYLDAARTRDNMARSLERLDHLVTARA
jgi:uncharacterized protein YndB with AHSA1/START domain